MFTEDVTDESHSVRVIVSTFIDLSKTSEYLINDISAMQLQHFYVSSIAKFASMDPLCPTEMNKSKEFE